MKVVQSIQSVLGIVWSLANDALRFLRSMFRSRTSLIAENLFLRKQLGFYQEHQIKPRRDRRRSPLPGLVVSVFRMEIGAGCGQAGHLDRLASPSFSPVLEVEVVTGQTANSAGFTRAHRTIGPRQSDLGRRARRRRAVVETRDQG